MSFFRDRLVWSAFDQARNGYVLMTHHGGVTSAVPVQARGVPFDADLGPDADGDTVAVYSRCGREPNFSPQGYAPPEWSSGRGCNVFQFNFATGRETRVASANTDGSSEFLPSIWETRIAFARVYERRPGRAGDRAYLYARTLLGTPRSTRLRGGPRAVPVETGPAALDLRGRRVAFAWATRGDCPGGITGIWLDTVGGGQQRIQSACNTNTKAGRSSRRRSPAVRCTTPGPIRAARSWAARSAGTASGPASAARCSRCRGPRRWRLRPTPAGPSTSRRRVPGEVHGGCAGCAGRSPARRRTPPCQLNEFTP